VRPADDEDPAIPQQDSHGLAAGRCHRSGDCERAVGGRVEAPELAPWSGCQSESDSARGEGEATLLPAPGDSQDQSQRAELALPTCGHGARKNGNSYASAICRYGFSS